ncbi:GNAT family N-acetyltransferase [Herbaspirillum sp. GCM10030257]|uniref:GNAT family N-acetyltransferase n=1 Tax=Herbaspirillum sp. GCM10030257 TaxID=3273393 RepID=UPI003620B5D7
MNIKVRHEQPADSAAIFDLTKLAFSTAAHTSHTEQFIVNALRTSGHLALSLVAVEEGRLVGHIAFSPVTISAGDDGWYGVGPLSVLPDFQRRGIGSLLMQQGLATLRNRGARGCVLVGDPAFYSRLGFSPCTELVFPGVPPEYLLGKSFGDAMPKGEVTFSPAFAATA